MMKPDFLFLLALAGAALPLSTEARPSRGGDQDDAYAATARGEVRSLRSIENLIVPGMKARGAEYIGQEFDGGSQRYRLKFMRGKSVIWVDVDGRTGAIIAQAGG